jgi:hypothetical protein
LESVKGCAFVRLDRVEPRLAGLATAIDFGILKGLLGIKSTVSVAEWYRAALSATRIRGGSQVEGSKADNGLVILKNSIVGLIAASASHRIPDRGWSAGRSRAHGGRRCIRA